MRVLGIDPGVTGGLAVLHAPGGKPEPLALNDMPAVRQQRGKKGSTGMVNAPGLALWLRNVNPDVAVMERVGARPGQGATSGFQFGRGVGAVEGVLAALDIALIHVESVAWKRSVGLPFGADKEASRALALRLYPTWAGMLGRKKDDGRAEALLIATAGLKLW